jgi:Holliday junction resolvase
MRKAGRTDANQQQIVATLRALGASVAITSGAGNGLPDLLVGWRGETYMLEVKDGNKPPSKKRLTAAEQHFVTHWQGRPVAIVETGADALRAIGLSI